MAEGNNAKRRRNSTGGTSDVLEAADLTYAQVAHIDLGKMSVNDKLDFLIHEMSTVKQLTHQVQQQQSQLSQLNDITENMQTEIVHMHHTLSQQQLRIIDLEARSRRNNLLFFNIPEPEQESDTGCQQALCDFLATQLKLNEEQLSRVVFQRVHRLGRPRRGVAPNGQAWKPRPVIAGFRDFKCKQDILFSSSCLKGSSFAMREDFPAEIRTARGKLWDDFKNAKSQNLRARIVYPAKLVVDERVVRDMFPEWGRWAMVGYEENRDRDTARIPRSGTPIDIPIGDLIGTRPTQRPQDQAQHPFETPPIVPSQIAYQHPPSAPSQSPPAVSDPPPLPRHPPPLPFIPPPLPRHPPPLSRHPPPLARHPPPAPRYPQPTSTHPYMVGTDAPNMMLQGAEGTTAAPVSGLAATPGQFPLTPVTMPDRVTNGHTPPGPADATSVPVPVDHPRFDNNTASGRESAPEPPPRRHRSGNGAPNTSPQPMYNGNAVPHSTSGQTSGHPNDGTTVRQSEQVTNELPNIVGNALSTVYEE